MRELPDGAEWVGFFSSLYDLYQRSGPAPAMELFRQRSFPEADRQVMARVPANDFSAANAAYWFEHELRQYPAVSLDLGDLKRHSDQLVLALGRESSGFPCSGATLALSKELGRQPLELPGGHIGFVVQAQPFAQALLPRLELAR